MVASVVLGNFVSEGFPKNMVKIHLYLPMTPTYFVLVEI